MQPRWVRWTVILIVALVAFALALSVVPADASGSVTRGQTKAPAGLASSA